MHTTYTIDDLAEMTGLSTRTLRNHLQLGLLDGEKIDGVWQFTDADFQRYLQQDMVRQSLQAKANGLLYDHLRQPKKPTATVCAVIDAPAGEDESALRDQLLQQVNARALQFHYSYAQGMCRVIVVGPPADVAALLQIWG